MKIASNVELHSVYCIWNARTNSLFSGGHDRKNGPEGDLHRPGHLYQQINLTPSQSRQGPILDTDYGLILLIAFIKVAVLSSPSSDQLNIPARPLLFV